MNPINNNPYILILAASQPSNYYKVVLGDRGQAITVPDLDVSAKVHALVKTWLEWENTSWLGKRYTGLGDLEEESGKWEALQIAATSSAIIAVSFVPQAPNKNQILYLEKCVENTPTYQWFIEPYDNKTIGEPNSISDLPSFGIHEWVRKHPKEIESLAQNIADAVLPTIQQIAKAFSKDLSSKAILITYQEPGSQTAQSLLFSKSE